MSGKQRLLTLDIFRGLTIAGMILVNNPGTWSHVYAPLRHAEWHGCTPTDLIFPFFLLVVGIAMAYSFEKYRGIPAKSVIPQVLKRGALIFLVGLLLHAFPFYTFDWDAYRVMGVLQRIGLAFVVAGVIVLCVARQYQLYVIAAILLLYWLLFLLLGGDSPYALTGNLVQQVDLAVLGANHMWGGLGEPHDPEGLLSTLPAVASVLIGYRFGLLIKAAPSHAAVAKQLMLLGIVGIVIGLVWGLAFPINKSLWTSSYVLYSAGWAAAIMAVLIWLVDIKGYKAWTQPALVYGVNPLFLYVFAWVISDVFAERIRVVSNGVNVSASKWVYEQLLVPLAGPLNGSLLHALGYVVVVWLAGWILYKKKIYIKI